MANNEIGNGEIKVNGLAKMARVLDRRNQLTRRLWLAVVIALAALAGNQIYGNVKTTDQIKTVTDTNNTLSHALQREASLTANDRTLFCAQGNFLSQVIKQSLAANPNTNPTVTKQLNSDLNQLDTAVSHDCMP